MYDDFGNRDYCSATVTVIDNIAPVLTCPADFTVGYNGGNQFYTVPSYGTTGVVTVVDNCATTITQDPIEGTELTTGTYTISFDVTDASGNTDSCSFELTIDGTLGSADFELESGLSIFPNPASEVITIASKNIALTSLEVVDILGKRIYSVSNLNSATTAIDISALSKGMYFVIINNTVTKKIIKK
nr:T9SS type A sorting domain-containing protein [Ulvibacter sp. MAR_2010_11]